MGFEDTICNTALTLSLLGSHHDVVFAPRENKKSACLRRPSLTLGGPAAAAAELKLEVAAEELEDGTTSMTSSFSNSSMKREREIGGGEEEEPKGSSGEDEEVVGTRKKLRLTKEQSVVLEDSFKDHSTLNSVISHSYFFPYFTLFNLFIYFPLHFYFSWQKLVLDSNTNLLFKHFNTKLYHGKRELNSNTNLLLQQFRTKLYWNH